MNFWNKSKTQHPNRTTATNSRPEDFEQKLVQIHFQARPDFREDLKARLLQNLSEQPPAFAPGKASLLPGLTHRRYLPARTKLALGGLGLAALLVLLVSVLSVGAVYRNPTASASVAAGGGTGATPVTKTTPASTAPASTIQAALRQFFDPAEAARMVGFTVNLPGYLPADYKLTYAAVNTPVTAPAPPANGPAMLSPAGYTLRFSDSTLPAAASSQIEIAQWQIPFTIEATKPISIAQTAIGTGPNEASYQSPQSLTVAGAPAIIIQGGQWQIQLATAQTVTATLTGPGQPGMSGPVSLNPPGVPIYGTTIITSAQPAIAPGSAAAGPIISFTQVGTGGGTIQGQPATVNSGGVVVGFNAQDARVKTLVWQQNSLFMVLTASSSLSDSELKKIAESLKSGG